MSKRTHGSVDLDGWSLPAIDETVALLESAAVKGAAEALELVLDDASLGFAITDDAGSDPLAVVVWFPDIASNKQPIENDTSLEIQFSLKDALASELEYCEEDGSYFDQLASIRDSLRGLADTIDTTLSKATKK